MRGTRQRRRGAYGKRMVSTFSRHPSRPLNWTRPQAHGRLTSACARPAVSIRWWTTALDPQTPCRLIEGSPPGVIDGLVSVQSPASYRPQSRSFLGASPRSLAPSSPGAVPALLPAPVNGLAGLVHPLPAPALGWSPGVRGREGLDQRRHVLLAQPELLRGTVNRG